MQAEKPFKVFLESLGEASAFTHIDDTQKLLWVLECSEKVLKAKPSKTLSWFYFDLKSRHTH